MLNTVAAAADKTQPTFTTGVLLAVGGTFLFALKSIFIKLAFAVGTNATELLTLRMMFSLPFYVAVLIYLNGRPNETSISHFSVVKAMTLGFLGYYLASYLDLRGLELISAQLERLTLFTYPLIVSILAWMFLGESLGLKIIAAIVLSYLGLVMMFYQEQLVIRNANTTLGVLFVMGSAFSYSLYILFAKPSIQSMGSRRFTSLAMIGSTVFVLVHFAATARPSELLKLPSVIYIYAMVLAFVCTVVPSYMINEAIARIGASRTTVVGAAGPVLTMALAIIVLQETTSLQGIAGMLVTVAGVSLVAKK